MYLIDESGLAQYNALKEKGFYGNVMASSAVFSIYCDSVKFNKKICLSLITEDSALKGELQS